ncbi:MAG TPA: SDR family NAD(P)-dependent oxidoreductase [Candidatus Limnocylindria bacterium]|nr:SDR family NAD(P)-dependent oxidoreductase [Candidatus Limnocylindria bacterium]
MSGSCDGRVALVTGGSRGIGAALAGRLAAEGARVAVTARTLERHPHLPGSLAETVAGIEAAGGTAVAIPADLTEPATRPAVVAEVERRLGPIDILVNNAAAAYYLPIERVTEKRYRIAFELNVRAPFELMQLVLPGMRSRRRGWILNISSATAVPPAGPPFDAFHRHGGALLYGSTKAALERMSAGLAAEVYEDGIAVNALAPAAAVRTPGVEALGMLPEDRPELIEPMEVMVEAAVALVTGDPRHLTGRIAYSRPLLAELGRLPRTLDGRGIYEETR